MKKNISPTSMRHLLVTLIALTVIALVVGPALFRDGVEYLYVSPTTCQTSLDSLSAALERTRNACATDNPDPIVTIRPDPIVTIRPDPIVTIRPDPIVTIRPTAPPIPYPHPNIPPWLRHQRPEIAVNYLKVLNPGFEVRRVEEGAMMTTDYRPNRLTVLYDRSGKITKIAQG